MGGVLGQGIGSLGVCEVGGRVGVGQAEKRMGEGRERTD